jgi:putative ABC transport system permease protein
MKLLRRLRALFRKDTLDREMSEEMRHHLELQVEENIAAGMNPDEARYQAQRQFGGVEQIKERSRDIRGWVWLEQLFQDLRYATRFLGKNRAFTATAVLTLALGIGISTAMFSVVYGVLLSPFIYAKSSDIRIVHVTSVQDPKGAILNIGDYLEIAKLPAIESAMADSRVDDVLSLAGENGLEVVDATRLSGTALPFLGVAPLAGRTFTPADFKANGDNEPVVMLSFWLWQRHFAGDRNAIGQTILLDRQPYVVIGVLPERFVWGGTPGVWLPLSTTDRKTFTSVSVRLRPGVTQEVAEQQLLALFLHQAHESPERFPKGGIAVHLEPLVGVSDRWGLRSSILALFWAAACLLLIACTNVANLQLARGAGRGREIAVRLAIGASRRRIVRQLLTESVLLSIIAGALGLFLAFGVTRLVVTQLPDYLPQGSGITVNGWVLAYSIGVALVSGVLFGLAPALRATKTDLNDALKDGGHAQGLGGRSGTRLRHTLVIVEMALSIVLLVSAALAIRNFVQLQQIDRGANLTRTAWMRFRLLPQRYPTVPQRTEFARALLERVRLVPGISSAAVGSIPNFDAASRAVIPGQPKPVERLSVNFVSADYFRTLAISVLAGRTFTAEEIVNGAHVAVINLSTSRQWPAGDNPIGSIIQLDALAAEGPSATKDFTVIGIVADTNVYVRQGAGRRATPQSAVFVPYPLRGATMPRPNERFLVVRTERALDGLIPALHQALRSVDPEQPMQHPMDLGEVAERVVAQPRCNMNLFTGFAVITLALAAAGIYSVLAYSVVQRTREFGVRMALGASREDILQLVLHGGAKLIILGSVVGFAASLALSQIVSSQVFEVPLLDPWAFGGAVILLGFIALLACWIPARRATRVDPMVALRHE